MRSLDSLDIFSRAHSSFRYTGYSLSLNSLPSIGFKFSLMYLKLERQLLEDFLFLPLVSFVTHFSQLCLLQIPSFFFFYFSFISFNSFFLLFRSVFSTLFLSFSF